MPAKLDKKLNKHFKKLSTTMALLSPGQGQPAQRVSLFDALKHADNCRKARNYAGARYVCHQLEKIPAAETEARVIRLQIAVEHDDTREIHALLQTLAARPPADPFGIEVTARALRHCGQHEGCIQLLSKGIRNFPTNASLRQFRGVVRGDVADVGAAVADLRRALRLDSQSFSTYRRLAQLGNLTDSDVQHLETVAVPEHLKSDVDASLASAYRERGDRAREMHHLKLANDVESKRWSWKATSDMMKTDEVVAACNEQFFASKSSPVIYERRPIFIVGMPRSGSTLIEQLLGQHPEIDTCGETHLVLALVDQLAEKHGAQYPQFLQSMDLSHFQSFAHEYLGAIDEIFTDRKVFVDKQLENHYFLGLLALAFPGARFVHSSRNAIDTCLSCYQQVFTTVPYANSFENLAAKFHNKQRLMDHWKELLGHRIHTVQYEDMVAAPEQEARALLEFCGVDWDPNVLRFFESNRSVRTASVQQVRQGIYTTSVDKWRAYEPHLGALKAALQMD